MNAVHTITMHAHPALLLAFNPSVLQAKGYDAFDESSTISPEARDLLGGLLTQSPDRRLTSAQVLGHPWLQHGVNRAWLDRHRAIVSAEVRALLPISTLKHPWMDGWMDGLTRTQL